MPLTPGYGETPVDVDELESLLPQALELLGLPVIKAAIYDLEQAIQVQVTEEVLGSVLEGTVDLELLLSDHYLCELHRALYGDIWVWAGRFRKRELNIGIAPEQIAVALRGSMESIHFRWVHTNDWSPRELGIAVHAECVRIHPFTDGNGRTTRLLADLVFAAAQNSEEPDLYDWAIDKGRYIDLLGHYDVNRESRDLADFIQVRPLGR